MKIFEKSCPKCQEGIARAEMECRVNVKQQVDLWTELNFPMFKVAPFCKVLGDQDAAASVYGGVMQQHSNHVAELLASPAVSVRRAALALAGVTLRQVLDFKLKD